ncbi:hypothetical protein [Alkalicoccus urumqiensis]|uniref:Uncharacterized protein n=1 Tax=Alkalicoccus urumqiensis TaxID=1548213 RepID=A0A2P6ML73_ALKUR|nr:hypothetical protein [Alkalicoccus urumqiensis]PRO67032.1 hypothetical protein C6I21_00250 [Alkalicoccus urumqiensis]
MEVYYQQYKRLERMAAGVLERIHFLTGINTIYIAKNNRRDMTVSYAYNAKETLLEKGLVLPYKDSY